MDGGVIFTVCFRQFPFTARLRVLETFTARSDGLPAVAAVADAESRNGQIVRLLVYFVEYRGRIYQFIAYSAPQSFGFFQDEFLRVMRGFGEVNDPAILATPPVRLKIERASRTAPFRSFIPARLPGEIRPEDVAILNPVTLNEEIQKGRALKLPGTQ